MMAIVCGIDQRIELPNAKLKHAPLSSTLVSPPNGHSFPGWQASPFVMAGSDFIDPNCHEESFLL